MKKFTPILVAAFALCGTFSACYGPPSRSVQPADPRQTSRSAGDAVDDSVIVAKVKSKLLADPDVSGLDINVDSYKGVVMLKGVVRTGREADEAIRLARETAGVIDVDSKLIVE